MAEVKWIKIVTNIFDDEKIKYIETLPNGDTTIVIWFRILCLAGKSNSGGLLMMTDKLAYTDEMLSSIFNRDIKVIQFSLNIFQSLGMIEVIENKIYLSNWDKHQSLDKLEQKKAYDREYQKKKRDENLISYNNRAIIVNNRSTDIELDIDIKNKNKDNTKISRTFVQPCVSDVEIYVRENNFNVDANSFIDYYTSNGWQVGRTKMKDWKATVRNWDRKNKPVKKEKETRPTKSWGTTI